MMDKERLGEIKSYINRMEHYGNMSGATAEIILDFIEEQQKEIERRSIQQSALEEIARHSENKDVEIARLREALEGFKCDKKDNVIDQL